MGVYKRQDAWYIDYYYLGLRYRQKIGTVRRAAEEALHRVKASIAAGDFVPPDQRQPAPESVAMSSFVEDDFLPWSAAEHSVNHHERLCTSLRVHLLPVFGDMALTEITAKAIEDYKRRRLRATYRRGKRGKSRPLSEATVNRELCTLKVVLRKAVDWGQLAASPARDVKVLKERPRPATLLEADQISRLLAAASPLHRALFACALYAGLRQGELRALRWGDIDWRAGEIFVRSTREHHTKNYASRRIPLHEDLRKALKEHPHHLSSDHVFPGRSGAGYSDVRDALGSVAKAAGIEQHVTMHQLRHAFCSHHLMQGTDPRTVQLWMGHKDLKTTMRYAHVSPAHEKSEVYPVNWTGEGVP